jgi:hypothetical protein
MDLMLDESDLTSMKVHTVGSCCSFFAPQTSIHCLPGVNDFRTAPRGPSKYSIIFTRPIPGANHSFHLYPPLVELSAYFLSTQIVVNLPAGTSNSSISQTFASAPVTSRPLHQFESHFQLSPDLQGILSKHTGGFNSFPNWLNRTSSCSVTDMTSQGDSLLSFPISDTVTILAPCLSSTAVISLISCSLSH